MYVVKVIKRDNVFKYNRPLDCHQHTHTLVNDAFTNKFTLPPLVIFNWPSVENIIDKQFIFSNLIKWDRDVKSRGKDW